MIKLKVLVEHENEFGTDRLKKLGKTYWASDGAAQALIANGYAEDASPKAAAETKKEG